MARDSEAALRALLSARSGVLVASTGDGEARKARRLQGIADVAQLVERRLPKPKVAGSRPVVRFNERAGNQGFPASGSRRQS